MAITINGSGTITGISTGGIPDGVVDTDVLADNAVTFGKIGTTEQSQLCKAWVNFDGTGTPSIRAAYNVSSITDNGTGDYTVNFTTALADTNYCLVGALGGGNAYILTIQSQLTSSASIYSWTAASVFIDRSIVAVAIFR